MKFSNTIIMLLGVLIALKILIFRILPFIKQYCLTTEINLPKRYGRGSWVLITGPSSGMGERFAYEFAERGFNLLLVGSLNTKTVIKKIRKMHPNIKIKFIPIDFSRSFDENFFTDIQDTVDNLGDRWSILVNNVGYRTGCEDYRNMSIEEMKKTISVGTLVQAKLMQMAIQKFSGREKNTSIISITAQNSLFTDLFAVDNDLTVPYLACYEATNAWGYFHAKSIYEEIKYKYPLIDFLIIMPGAVKTKNTKQVLKNTIFAIDVETYIKNIMKLVGNYNGPMCAYWGHSISSGLINIFPFFDKESIVEKVGSDFSKSFAKRLN